ncbi:MAG: methyltransferase domain-containing protein [Candidatus Eisenbacteria bacterium]
MSGYYTENLAAERLRRVYEIAPPRIRQYLDAEVAHVVGRIRPGDTVLDLGCGYGRVLARLAAKAGRVVGIDTSLASLQMGQGLLGRCGNCRLICMDAARLGFRNHAFDLVACVQNGISAFHCDERQLVGEAVRVTRPGGAVLFSTYSPKFWDDRLKWFALQSEAGLLGEIDNARTGDGVIACKDGFTGRAVKPERFFALAADLGVDATILEIDESSIFCEIAVGVI